MRILSVGIGTNQIFQPLSLGAKTDQTKKYDYFSFTHNLPTIFDYDMVILDLGKAPLGIGTVLENKKPEFDKFFESGGICYVITSDNTYFDWCPFIDKLKIVNKSGSSVSFIDNRTRSIFGSIGFHWSLYFSDIIIDYKVLARNRSEDPISIRVPYKNGFCIFLPTPDPFQFSIPKISILDLILERGLELIPEPKDSTNQTSLPSWANTIVTSKEKLLIEKQNIIKKKLGKFSKFKQLYWETGKALEILVLEAFEELTIETTKLPKESHADLEMQLDNLIIGVCEIKGLLGAANIQDLRQLLDYYVEQRDIEKRNVKGIFVINHYRNQEPKSRGSPATLDALELISKHDFRLITTIQLYEVLVEFWDKNIKRNEILKKLGLL